MECMIHKKYICAVNKSLEVFGINMIIDAMEVSSYKACRRNKGQKL